MFSLEMIATEDITLRIGLSELKRPCSARGYLSVGRKICLPTGIP